jgi:hypothetical protein
VLSSVIPVGGARHVMLGAVPVSADARHPANDVLERKGENMDIEALVPMVIVKRYNCGAVFFPLTGSKLIPGP